MPLEVGRQCWLDTFVIFRGSGSILLGNPIFLWFFRGVPDPHPHMDPPKITMHMYIKVKSPVQYYRLRLFVLLSTSCSRDLTLCMLGNFSFFFLVC